MTEIVAFCVAVVFVVLVVAWVFWQMQAED